MHERGDNRQNFNRAEVQKGFLGVTVEDFQLLDKKGGNNTVRYFKFPEEVIDNSEDSRIKSAIDQVRAFAALTFPNYDAKGMETFLNKFRTNKVFDLIYNEQNEIVGFHIYKTTEIDGIDGQSAKVMYVDHAGVRPDHEERGLTTLGREAIYNYENPDIICGSSANGAIYLANQRVAKDRGMTMYPSGPETPGQVYDVAHEIAEKLGLNEKAKLDPDLRRTYYDGAPVSKGRIPHPLHEELPLGPASHVFYIMMKPDLHDTVLTRTPRQDTVK